MDLAETQKYVSYQLCEKLKPHIEELYGIILYLNCDIVAPEKSYQLLKDIAIISGELLDNKKNKDEFEKLLKSTVVDSRQYHEKSETFRMLRNLIAHFPIFEKWEDIFITKNMLRWNNKIGFIEGYFSKNSGRKLEFSVYTRKDSFYNKTKDFEIIVPELKESKRTYLKDIISLENAMWLFALVGYYLEWKDWQINPDTRYCGCVSA